MSLRAAERPVQRLALSRTEVAISIGVSVSSVDVMVTEGALPPPRCWHSRKLWLVEEITAHLRELPAEGDNRTHRLAPYDEDHLPGPAVTKGPGGYPIFDVPDHALKQHYDELGFDPRTMDEADMVRLRGLAEEKWKVGV